MFSTDWPPKFFHTVLIPYKNLKIFKNSLTLSAFFFFFFFSLPVFSLWEALSLSMVFLFTFCNAATEPFALPALFLKNWWHPHHHQWSFLKPSELCFPGPGWQPISFDLSDPRFSLPFAASRSFALRILAGFSGFLKVWLWVTSSQALAVLYLCIRFISLAALGEFLLSLCACSHWSLFLVSAPCFSDGLFFLDA